MEADTPGLGAEPSQKNISKSPDDQVQDEGFLGILAAELFRVRSLCTAQKVLGMSLETLAEYM